VTPQRASRTAEFMALFRALESVRHPVSARLFDDRFARGFLRPSLRAVVDVSRVPVVGRAVAAYIDRRWPGARSSGIARTRLIDDLVEEALRDGIAQLVILGAGFDCLYLSFTLLQLGIGLWANNAWVVAMLVPTLVLMSYGVIAREERYMEQKFGDEYRRYQAAVRRWI